MTRYLSMTAVQRPFPFNVDENDRTMFSCNYQAHAAAPVALFEEEIVKILEDVGLASLGNDTFVGPKAPIPAGPGPYITVLDRGGFSPQQNQTGEEYERLSFQIIVRALSYSQARARALAIWRELDGRQNFFVFA